MDIFIGRVAHFYISAEKDEALFLDLDLYDDHIAEKKKALKYIMARFPTIKKVTVNDIVLKKGTDAFATPQRLLLGQPGWYEEHFGAKPSLTTGHLLHNIRKETLIMREVIDKPLWGTNNDLELISKNVLSLVNSDWLIDRQTIESWSDYDSECVEYPNHMCIEEIGRYNNVFIEHIRKKWGS